MTPRGQKMPHSRLGQTNEEDGRCWGKKTMEGEDRPARAAWLYVTRLVHGPDKAARG
jgi:hypothetical protein